jgi:hypothetical protein
VPNPCTPEEQSLRLEIDKPLNALALRDARLLNE